MLTSSKDKILTTHVGSLPRTEALIAAMIEADAGKTVNADAYAETLKSAVADVVAMQVELGVDVVSDGEFSKRGFAVYVNERLGGIEPTDHARPSPWAQSREAEAFPEFYAPAVAPPAGPPTLSNVQMVCTRPITYAGHALLERDLDNFKAAAGGAAEAFVPAISPCDVAGNLLDQHYDDDEAFLYAISDAMNVEYKAIVDAGFMLQIDDPRLINYYVKNPQLSVEECRRWAETQVEAINHSLKGIPTDRVRYHTCYGINMGPRVHDMELKHYIDIMLKVDAIAYSFEAANPRHEHEWRLWEDVALPDGKSIIPGVITHSSVVVEHPELIAERILRYAGVVGRERVIAGGDCGFGTQALREPEIHPSIVSAKFEALVEGARIAGKTA